MKKKQITVIVAANLFVLVMLVFLFPQFMISPGKPVEAHIDLADDCFACHTPFIGSTAEQCIDCHAVADIGIKTTKGLLIDKEQKNVAFHQKLVEEDCMACHSEHKGVQPFRPIGQFSHELLQTSVKEQCDSCHSNPADGFHKKITGNCSQCHSNESWLPATFDHEKYFRFDKDHNTECATCHINNDYTNYTCYGCHEHSRSNIREEHLEEGIRDYENCVDCHRSGDEDEAKRIWRSGSYKSKMQQQLNLDGVDQSNYRKHDHDD